MLRSVFTRLLGGGDVTASWPRANVVTPELHLQQAAIGPLRFGSPLEDAFVFGRPNLFTKQSNHSCSLVHGDAGFQIDYDHGKLAYVAFFVGPDDNPPSTDIRFCQPKLTGVPPLTNTTSEQEILEAFGQPSSIDRDTDETILYFKTGSLTLEFELTAAGTLRRVNAYPTNRPS